MRDTRLNNGSRIGLFIDVINVGVYSIIFMAIVGITLQYSTKLAEFLNTSSGRNRCLFTMLLAGIALFYFRNQQQFWYGVFQTCFGMVFTFLTFKIIAFRIVSGQVLKTYGITLENLHVLMPLIYLFVMVVGISNTNRGWKKNFYFKNLIERGLVKIFSLGYGPNLLALSLSLTMVPFYYICYLSFQDDPVAILKRESHVREETNSNDHPRIAFFNRSHHMLPANSAYCGTSIEWAIKKAGWELDVAYPPRARSWAEKQKNIIWSKANGMESARIPSRNDVVVCYDQGNWHVGLLEDWQEGSSYCKTIEGNTTDRNVATIINPVDKEGIYEGKLRNKNDIYCIVRPYHIPHY